MDKELGDLYRDDKDLSRRKCRNVSHCSGVALTPGQARWGVGVGSWASPPARLACSW